MSVVYVFDRELKKHLEHKGYKIIHTKTFKDSVAWVFAGSRDIIKFLENNYKENNKQYMISNKMSFNS